MSVEQKFIGDASHLEREYEKILKLNEKYKQKLAEVADQSEKSSQTAATFGERIAQASQKGMANLQGLALKYFTVTQAINVATQAMEHQRRLADEAYKTNLTVAQSQAGIIRNIGNVTQAELAEFFRATDMIAKKASFESVVPINNAAADVLSAVGGNRAVTLQILEQAAPFFIDKPSDLGTFGGALGDMIKQSGGTLDPKQALAMGLAIQGQARFSSLGGFANVGPALGSVTNLVDSDPQLEMRQGAALFAALGSQNADPTGGTTKTTVTNLVGGLRDTIRESGKDTAGMSIFQMLEQVQQSPELQKAFLGRGGIPGEFRGVVESLILSPQGNIAQSVMESYKAITVDVNAVDEKLAQLKAGTDELKAQQAEGISKLAVEQYERDSNVAQNAAARTFFTRANDKQGWLRGTMDRIGMEGESFFRGDVAGSRAWLTEQVKTTDDPAQKALFQGQLDALNSLNKSTDEVLAEIKLMNGQLSQFIGGRVANVAATVAAQSRVQDERD